MVYPSRTELVFLRGCGSVPLFHQRQLTTRRANLQHTFLGWFAHPYQVEFPLPQRRTIPARPHGDRRAAHAGDRPPFAFRTIVPGERQSRRYAESRLYSSRTSVRARLGATADYGDIFTDLCSPASTMLKPCSNPAPRRLANDGCTVRYIEVLLVHPS